MNMRRIIYTCLMLCCLICVASIVSAQQTDAPLILLRDNVLWTWSGNESNAPVQYDALPTTG